MGIYVALLLEIKCELELESPSNNIYIGLTLPLFFGNARILVIGRCSYYEVVSYQFDVRRGVFLASRLVATMQL